MGSKWTLGRLVGGVEWIQLTRDRDRWRAVVNAVMNLGARELIKRGFGRCDKQFIEHKIFAH
jgi:hypothetical protein